MLSKADIHIHTTCSDGLATPEELVDYIVANSDLRVIAVTDHDTTAGGYAAQQHALRLGYHLDVIIGQEVTTDEGDILALFVQATLPTFRSARAAIEAIHHQGGLAIAPSPYSAWDSLGHIVGLGSRIVQLPLDGVEVRHGFPANFMNAHNMARHYRHWCRLLPELGGSDSHSLFTVGQVFTWFPGRSAKDLRAAVARGVTWAGGPAWKLTCMAQRAAPMHPRSYYVGRSTRAPYADGLSG
ncbi:MAG: phosphotransferase [Caldilineaceae bacterium]|nr:phosphotransferase [Caldilineaceae bacterium]